MAKVFHVELSNGSGLYCELELPATDYQLLDALERLKMKPGDRPGWEILNHNGFKYLHPFLGGECSIYELNALAQELGSMNNDQLAAFEGLMALNRKDGSVSMTDLMTCANHTDCCHVVGEAFNDAQLGRFYAENGFVAELTGLSDSVFEKLDFARIGKEMRKAENGVYTRFGYVTQHSDMEQVHHTLPQIPRKPDYIFRLTLSNSEESHAQHNVSLELPAAEAELDAALEKLDAPSWEEVVFHVEDSAIPGILDDADCFDGMEQINRLAMTIRRLDETGQLTKYKAVLEATHCTDLDTAAQLACQLDEYILDSGSRSVEDVARGELRTVMDEKSAEILLPHLDLYYYGLDLMKRHNSEMTPYGLVERSDGAPILSERNQPSQGGMEMT